MSDRYSGGGSGAVADQEPVDPAHRLRVLLGAALGCVLSSYLLMGAVGALAGLSAGASPDPSALLTVGVPLWLAANQVPLTLAGAPLSMLPLLPTIAVAAVAANFAAAAIDKLGRRWGGEAAWVVFALAGAQGSLAILGTALPIGSVEAQPWQALLGGGLIAGVGAVAGVLREVGLPDGWQTAPHWLRVALVSGLTGAVGLLTAGALMLFAGLATNAVAVHDGFDARPGWGAGIGITVLSLGYLPNALVAAVSWLAGPGVDVGAATASPVGVTVGPLPPIPLLAAMPSSQPPGWAVAVFVLPAAIGVLVGLGCRRADSDSMIRLRAVWTAILVVGGGFAVLASVSGGRLAGGPFDPVDLSAYSNALALLGWLGVPAMVTVLLPPGLGRRPRGRRARSVEEAVAGVPGVAVSEAPVSEAPVSEASGFGASGSEAARGFWPEAADADADQGRSGARWGDREPEAGDESVDYAGLEAGDGSAGYVGLEAGDESGAYADLEADEELSTDGGLVADDEPEAYGSAESRRGRGAYVESELYDESELYRPGSSRTDRRHPSAPSTDDDPQDVGGDTAPGGPGSVG